MLTSAAWINDYLDRPADPEEQADLLTRAGFPLEETEAVGDDVRQDYEMTSNRGDCNCHVGLAREIAAISGRNLVMPIGATEATGPDCADLISISNEDHSGCPLYTGRVIRGVKVGPSPAWLRARLEARGDIPRNNVVDATNFVLFELGQPTHVFDLATLTDNRIVIRRAAAKERFLPLGEGATEIELTTDDLVIADGQQPVALAGVKGGALSAVHEGTTDVLLEAATFAPVTVRNTSRRHGITSDSSYRFERGVHPAAVDVAADRLAQLIIELAGGELCAGSVRDGAPIPDPVRVSMRPARCRRILGVPITTERMLDGLERLGFAPTLEGDAESGTVHCTVPVHRLDIEREIDLIEEVARMHGLDSIPVEETIAVRVAPPQPEELARRAVADLLVGLGFLESVTHSLVGDDAAAAFMPPDLGPLRVDDERAKAEPVLRPSVLPSLLRVLGHNLAHGARNVRFFERAATFALREKQHLETVNTGFLHPAEGDNPLRETRGIVERVARALAGPDATVEVEEITNLPWLRPGAVVSVNGDRCGTYGLLDARIASQFGIDVPVCVAELGLEALAAAYPPDTEARPLPSFPAIERDLSLVIDEATNWGMIAKVIGGEGGEDLEGADFVTVFRGKPIPAGRKSVTARLRFRRSDRTLTHEEVDPVVDRVIAALTAQCGAEIRT